MQLCRFISQQVSQPSASFDYKRIKALIDANAYKQEMVGATPENYRDKLAHSQTRLGQTFYSVIQISENSAAKFGNILTILDDEKTGDILTTETLLNREKRSR